MAVTAQKSTQLTNVDAEPRVFNETTDYHGRLRFSHFDFTQDGAGDATSTVDFLKLPSGKLRIFWDLSFWKWDAFGASRVIDIGHTGYTNTDDTDVAADPDAYDNDVDVSSAGEANMGSDVTALTTSIDSKDGVLIQATVAGGTIPDTTEITGYLVYAQD
jgi:hypothetical protein